ncbi:MAG: hemerythrin domain-containing protein [Deltaproteobacteria bacterium]|nr:hemerythrin domain-containing protein [Deltaproteobacteria bacterium]
MKRDARLQPLSRDHHRALVLARDARTISENADASDGDLNDAWSAVRRAFVTEISPHFQIEEETLLPAMLEAGEEALVRRTLEDHAAILGCVSDREGPLRGRLARFGALLQTHVDFEEHELFERAQEILSPDDLARVEAASNAQR